MIRVQVLTRKQVEDKAYSVLGAYYGTAITDLEPPVDIEMIIEAHLKLIIEWDIIEDDAKTRSFSHGNQTSLKILAGLYPRSRRIVLNEKHVDLYRISPGLERFTKGHEIGHWVLHIDHAVLDHPTLFDFDASDDKEAIICRDGDDTWIERQANWFSSGLIMPKEMFLRKCASANLKRWDCRYELAEQFGVTVSALGVRLEQLGLSHVDEQGRFHRSIAERNGQAIMRP